MEASVVFCLGLTNLSSWSLFLFSHPQRSICGLQTTMVGAGQRQYGSKSCWFTSLYPTDVNVNGQMRSFGLQFACNKCPYRRYYYFFFFVIHFVPLLSLHTPSSCWLSSAAMLLWPIKRKMKMYGWNSALGLNINFSSIT